MVASNAITVLAELGPYEQSSAGHHLICSEVPKDSISCDFLGEIVNIFWCYIGYMMLYDIYIYIHMIDRYSGYVLYVSSQNSRSIDFLILTVAA